MSKEQRKLRKKNRYDLKEMNNKRTKVCNGKQNGEKF